MESSFVAQARVPLPDSPDIPDVKEEIREDVSDGLVLRSASSFVSWLRGTYLRADCCCGHCPASDPEPCPYARPAPQEAGGLRSVLSGASRGLQRMLSSQPAEPNKQA